MIIFDAMGATLVGFAGAGHCMGMCGGVAAALTFALPENHSLTRKISALLLYNIGRISAYTLAGLIIGGLFASITELSTAKHALAILRLFAGGMMILLALYMGQWWFGLQKIERAGQFIWRGLKPLAQKMLPLRHPLMTLPLGFIWGWLPCGLVYSSLSWAAASGSAMSGGAIMLFFGLGTLPAMLAVGHTAEYLRKLLATILFKRVSALLLLTYGLQTAYVAVQQLT
ncbi:MAG: sulfite exporter TauE/SafE family protein [Plesiomonas sp.]|uniref:sulfite exporter TauE/SafE family protein n=1 Tax=Plesiomonas sp. TaxID=2486279 RepID=UPI003F3443BF